MTKAQLVTDLMNTLGPGVDVDATGLTTWINDAYMYMVDAIQEAIPDYFTQPAFTTIVSGQQEYSLPDDYDRLVMVNINLSGVWRRALPLPNINTIPVHENPTTFPLVTVDPRYYLIGNEIGLLSIPTDTIANGLKIWYVYNPLELSDDSDVPAFPAKYHHLIKLGASSPYLDRDSDHGDAGNIWERFEHRVEKMVETLSQMQVDEPKSVEVTQDLDLYMNEGIYV